MEESTEGCENIQRKEGTNEQTDTAERLIGAGQFFPLKTTLFCFPSLFLFTKGYCLFKTSLFRTKIQEGQCFSNKL